MSIDCPTPAQLLEASLEVDEPAVRQMLQEMAASLQEQESNAYEPPQYGRFVHVSYE